MGNGGRNKNSLRREKAKWALIPPSGGPPAGHVVPPCGTPVHVAPLHCGPRRPTGLGLGARRSGDGLRRDAKATFQDDGSRSQSSAFIGLAFCILHQQVQLRSRKSVPRDEVLGFDFKRLQRASAGPRRRDLFEKLDFLEQVSFWKFP